MPLAVRVEWEHVFVRKKVREQREARRLRREGRSLREIAYELNVSLTSASAWVRGIPREPAPRSRTDLSISQSDADGAPALQCGRCRRRLPESAFNLRGSGRQYWCRECFKQYFRERGDLHRRQSAAAKRRRQKAARAFVAAYLSASSCRDCREADSRLLEFDHIGPKRGDISVMKSAGASLEALRREIAACEVVCVNCHRRRTASRAGWRRAADRWWETAPPKRYETARNLAVAYSFLERSSCADCGEADMVVLDFDHVGPKKGTVLQLASDGVGLATLKEEISRCEIRCANCHRLRHASARGREHAQTRG